MQVRYWDVTAGEQVARLDGHGDYVRTAAASPAQPDLWATGSYDHTCRLWDVRAGEVRLCWHTNLGPLRPSQGPRAARPVGERLLRPHLPPVGRARRRGMPPAPLTRQLWPFGTWPLIFHGPCCGRTERNSSPAACGTCPSAALVTRCRP